MNRSRLGPVLGQSFIIDHYVFSNSSLLPPIPEGLVSVTSKGICREYWLINESSLTRITDRFDMSIAFDSDVKPQIKHSKIGKEGKSFYSISYTAYQQFTHRSINSICSKAGRKSG